MYAGSMDWISCIDDEVLTRSISAENPDGSKGGGARCELEDGSARDDARDLGKGWKVNPCYWVEPNETITLGDIQGMGAIKHIWMTTSGPARSAILRFYWDGCEEPAIECPLGDFFACGWGKYSPISSYAVCVNPSSGFNCYWTMPFRKGFRITLENQGLEKIRFFFQITYELRKIPENAGYFHAQFRRVNPLPFKEVYTILDRIEGKGQYVGTYLAWGVNNCGWWGEGEIKFYMDGDDEYPTICGTGTEDYFGGSWDFIDPDTKDRYKDFSNPYTGFFKAQKTDELFQSQTRFSMYRWHITEPIRFAQDMRVTIQALGWRSGRRYMPLQDDIASVAYFYLDKPCAPRPELPDAHALEVV